MENDSEDYAKKSAEFKRWLALYFIDKGNWKLTDKAIDEFGTDATPRQTMEFGEVCSDREREERSEYRVGLTPKEKKNIAHMKVADMLDEGKAGELYDGNYIVNGLLSWKDKNVRVNAVRKLLEILNKDPRDITKKDLDKNKLGGLLASYYNKSPYKAVKEAFPEMDIKPWEMASTPRKFYEKGENRVAAVKWLIEKLKKDPRDLTQEDFMRNRFGGLCGEYYNNSLYEAVKEAFPEKNIMPWEMKRTITGFYEKKENRVAAVKWLIEKLKKDPRDLTQEDFKDNGLTGLLTHYTGSPYKAIKEAFPDIKFWEMIITPKGFYEKKENRVAAVKWLIEKLKKDPRDLTQEDFKDNGLTGLLNHYYNGSPYEAVKEAFPEMDIKPWEMASTPRKFYERGENRVAAVKWLIEKLKKDPRDLTQEDLFSNRLSGLSKQYNGSPYEALKEAGLVTEADEKYMRKKHGGGFLTSPSSTEALEAAKKLARNAEKKPTPKAKQRLRR